MEATRKNNLPDCDLHAQPSCVHVPLLPWVSWRVEGPNSLLPTNHHQLYTRELCLIQQYRNDRVFLSSMFLGGHLYPEPWRMRYCQ